MSREPCQLLECLLVAHAKQSDTVFFGNGKKMNDGKVGTILQMSRLSMSFLHLYHASRHNGQLVRDRRARHGRDTPL